MLGVIIGSIHIADASIQESFSNYLNNLERWVPDHFQVYTVYSFNMFTQQPTGFDNT